MNIFSKIFPTQTTRPTSVLPYSLPAPPEKTYAMRHTGADSAEIVLYGDIVSERPTDWDGKPIDGQYIILNEFMEDLKQVEDAAHLTIHIHSAGGNAYDAMAIHNRLKSLTAEVTVIVDGVAMSGGSLIMAAGDTVQVYPGSLVMIHKCWSFLFGGYNASELRKMADSNDAVDRSQATIYHTKTGIDTQKLLSMMEAETYLTGQEAVDMGFADELLDGGGVDVAASADRCTLFAGGIPVWVSTRTGGIPDTIPTVTPEAAAPVEANTNQPAQTGGQNGGNTMAKTLEELRAENPALAEAFMAEARAAVSGGDDSAQAERKRIQEIDALADLFDAETINAAKYGDHPCTAQEMVYQAAQRASQQGGTFLAALEADTAASGVQGVGAANGAGSDGAGGTGGPDSPQAVVAQAQADAKAFNERKREVR